MECFDYLSTRGYNSVIRGLLSGVAFIFMAASTFSSYSYVFAASRSTPTLERIIDQKYVPINNNAQPHNLANLSLLMPLV